MQCDDHDEDNGDAQGDVVQRGRRKNRALTTSSTWLFCLGQHFIYYLWNHVFIISYNI